MSVVVIFARDSIHNISQAVFPRIIWCHLLWASTVFLCIVAKRIKCINMRDTVSGALQMLISVSSQCEDMLSPRKTVEMGVKRVGS